MTLGELFEIARRSYLLDKQIVVKGPSSKSPLYENIYVELSKDGKTVTIGVAGPNGT